MGVAVRSVPAVVIIAAIVLVIFTSTHKYSLVWAKKDAKEMKTSSKLSPIQLMILSITIDELCKLGQVITTL